MIMHRMLDRIINLNIRVAALVCITSSLAIACSSIKTDSINADGADLILTNAHVYTLDWNEPALDGTPANNAPYRSAKWRPDAQAVAIANGEVLFVGQTEEALKFKSAATRVVDLKGATVVPGLVDSHTHFIELGAKLSQVDLTDIATEEEAVALVAAKAKTVKKGEWIFGAGWDEGAWANRYPDKKRLSEAVPDNPVALYSLHGFAMWTNQAALDTGGITASSVVPVGGDMRMGPDGQPNGLFLNNATTIVKNIVPTPSVATLKEHALAGLNQMAKDGYVTVHEAGVKAESMQALEQLAQENRLPIRVYAMLSLRDEDLINKWIKRGPDTKADSMLVTRSVKAYYDGALGSRGARLLEDYADQPGHKGISGDGYGFNKALNQRAMQAGFQIGIHAIGDAGNRESLDILETVFKFSPSTQANRHRIEHAQIIHPGDIPRLAKLGIIASMEPPHAMEDKAWAEERLGKDRMNGAYAWRSLRLANTSLTFNADNPGSDHSIFYGLHSAVTRQDKQQQPPGGWYPEQRVTIEEAVRAYTIWSAYAAFRENETGVIAKGRWADLTVMDIDPFQLAGENPADILNGSILMTIVKGQVIK
ncbi:MAG: amidohydrolase [Gammaproteobacteria bacterium]